MYGGDGTYRNVNYLSSCLHGGGRSCMCATVSLYMFAWTNELIANPHCFLPPRVLSSSSLHVHKYVFTEKEYLFSCSIWLASRVITFSLEGLTAECKWQIWHICIYHVCRSRWGGFSRCYAEVLSRDPNQSWSCWHPMWQKYQMKRWRH